MLVKNYTPPHSFVVAYNWLKSRGWNWLISPSANKVLINSNRFDDFLKIVFAYFPLIIEMLGSFFPYAELAIFAYKNVICF